MTDKPPAQPLNESLTDILPIEKIKDFSFDNAELIHLAVTWGGRALAAVLILIVGWMIGNWIDRRISHIKRLDATLRNFLGGLIKYTIISISIITVIGLFGIPMASLIAVLGAAGLAIGLALQGTLSNVAAGVMLLILRPFNVGDYITFGNQGGTVKHLGLFGTELAMPDNVYVYAPNSKIWGNEIQNFSRNAHRRQDILTNISHKDDIDKAFEVIYGVLKADDRILSNDPGKEPKVMVDTIAEFSTNLIVRFWSNSGDYWALRWDITKAIKEAFDANGITIPFPTRTVEVLGQQDAAAAGAA